MTEWQYAMRGSKEASIHSWAEMLNWVVLPVFFLIHSSLPFLPLWMLFREICIITMLASWWKGPCPGTRGWNCFVAWCWSKFHCWAWKIAYFSVHQIFFVNFLSSVFLICFTRNSALIMVGTWFTGGNKPWSWLMLLHVWPIPFQFLLIVWHHLDAFFISFRDF